MDSRNNIIEKLRLLKREGGNHLPEVVSFRNSETNLVTKFMDTLSRIGGTTVELETKGGINEFVLQQFPAGSRILSLVPGIIGEQFLGNSIAHSFESVDLFILEADFAVAENAACWVTADKMGDRVLPFVCQHLAILLRQSEIVETLHDAYDRIADSPYEFATFIAGPSKTADIEQSLVLGAHGPKTLTVFLLP